MGLLLGLLKGAAGEVQLGSRFGRWMKGISSILDASNINGAPRYVQARRATNLIGFAPAIDTVVSLADGVLIQNGIPYDGATGVFRVPAGRFRLHMSATFVSFSDANGGSLDLVWVNANDTSVGYGVSAKFLPTTFTTADAPNPNADAVVEFTEETDVALFVSGISGAGLTMTLPQGGLDITITELR